jgi:hypothetical protein
MAVLLLAAVIAVALYLVKSGGTAKIRRDVETFSRAKVSLTETALQTLQRQVENYIATRGATPAGLDALKEAGPLTFGKQDAWGRNIRYERLTDSTYRLISAGPDGKFDTGDDIAREY